MIVKSAKNKWARQCQSKLLNIASETDSCACISAGVSIQDREELRRLAEKMTQILSKY